MKRNEAILDMAMTGMNIKRIMKEKGYTVRDVQNYLELSTPQAIYHWFDGKNMPTIDNLYALSGLFCIPVDAMLRGNRKYVFLPYYDDRRVRLYMYYERLLDIAHIGLHENVERFALAHRRRLNFETPVLKKTNK